MNKSEQINELATAMAKAQMEIENASKNAANPHFRSKYADLAEVLNTVRPVFAKNGLAVIQSAGFDNGCASVETTIAHSSGQWISSTVSAPVSKQDAQGVGSALTYCRRYGLAAMAGIAQEDDDANAAVGGGQKPAAKPSNKILPVYPAEQMAENLPKWQAAIEQNRSSADGVISMISTKFTLTADQKQRICALQKGEAA